MPAASYVICTRNRPDALRRCLASVTQQTVPPEEVIVVDASDTGVASQINRVVQAMAGRANVRLLRPAAGLPRQRNRGAEEAQGEIVCFLDDDVVLFPDYHEEILRVYRQMRGQNLGGVQGTIVNRPPTSRWVAPFRLLFLLPLDVADGWGRMWPSGNGVYLTAPRDVRPVEVMSGCCSSFWREIILQIRFDEALGGYAFKEDLDFSWRVSRRYRLVQTPWARLEHHPSPVWRDGSSRRTEMRLINNYYLAHKNLPATLPYRVAFSWSLLGEVLWAMSHALAHRDFGYARGAVHGLWAIARGGHRLLRPLPPATGAPQR